MTLLLLLAACGRSPAPVVETESLSEDQRPQRMEAVSAERSGRIVLAKYWRDGDRDGYGTPGTSLWATERPWRYVPVGGDCNPRDAAINPGATEVEGDGVDNDCDGTVDESEADTGDTADTASPDSGTDTSVVDTASPDTGDSGSDSGTDSGDSADTGVVASTGILVSRDSSDGLTYPATIYAWYGSSTTAQLEVSSASATLNFAPSDADLSNHSWVDIQASWASGANWSDDCSGFSVESDDYTVALYENTVSTATDTCRIYVGLAVPSGGDVGVWTLVP